MNLKKHIIVFLISIMFFSCSNKYTLEKKTNIKISEAYYNKWVSGVNGGGSGLQIFLNLETEINFKEDKIQLKRIFFRQGHSNLKKTAKNKFQAFIKTNDNSTNLELQPVDNKTDETKLENNKTPFKLKENEAILYYIEKGIDKYFKFSLKEKTISNFPM